MTDVLDPDEFGDFEPEDAFSEGDVHPDHIDWERVIELQGRIDALYGLPPEEFEYAASLLTLELNDIH